MSGGVQKRWLSVKSRIIRSYFEKKPRSRKKSKKVKKELSYYNMIKNSFARRRSHPITTMTSQIMDLTSQNTAYLQRINELERSATLDSNNSCKPPSSDGLRKPNGKKDKVTTRVVF